VTVPDDLRARLRALPAVDQLAAAIVAAGRVDDAPVAPSPAEAVTAARAVLGQRRAELHDGAVGDADLVARGRTLLRPTLRRVLNGTGVIVHTNLGRAPLAEPATAAVAEAARGYANVELELETGRRGSRHDHVAGLLRELTGAEDALAVNNGAAAALLAVAALAGPGTGVAGTSAALGGPGAGVAGTSAALAGPGAGVVETGAGLAASGAGVAVSRGQLVEIGGGFRVPDVLAQAGARLVEVGTTNRTRLADYERALAPVADGGAGATAILRVHQSNFRTVGFVEEVAIEALCALGVPVLDDLGSGALARGLDALSDEPPVARSVAAGAAIVCFSGDKLLGGPQAGLLVGRAAAIDACRRHPLARALRIGRLPLAGLAATLALYRDPARARREIPVLAMLDAPPRLLRRRTEQLAEAAATASGARAPHAPADRAPEAPDERAGLDPSEARSPRVAIVEATTRVGGGALPLLELRGPALALGAPGEDPAPLAGALRAGDPPLLARIAGGRVLVDPRTLADDELAAAAAAIAAALRATAPS
jgi:L-seryl-tRNA(Ser) seleniumtransferase